MDICSRCGEKHERQDADQPEPRATCTGHTVDGTPCRNWPIIGGTVCYQAHGGRRSNVQAAAQQRIERARAEGAVATFGLARDVDPFVALKEEIARTAGHVQWLQQIISEMEPIDLVWGMTSEETTQGDMTLPKGFSQETSSASVKNEAGLNTWLRLYQDERKHLVQVCAVAIKCGLAQREVELLESQGKLIADFVRSFIDDPELAFEADMRQLMRQVASRHLRQLSPAAA